MRLAAASRCGKPGIWQPGGDLRHGNFPLPCLRPEDRGFATISLGGRPVDDQDRALLLIIINRLDRLLAEVDAVRNALDVMLPRLGVEEVAVPRDQLPPRHSP